MATSLESIVAGYEQRLALIHWWSEPANDTKAQFELSAAKGWTSYRELKAAVRQVRERFATYRAQRPRSFNGEMADEVALEREDQLIGLFLRDLDAITDKADE